MTGLACPTLELASTPESVRAARRYVTDRLRSWGMESLVDTAALLVSEVVTNSVLHARTDLHLTVAQSGDDAVTITVADLSQQVPRHRRYAQDATTGRGVLLLDQLSSEWTVDVTSTGKAVSFTMHAGVDPWSGFADTDWEALER